ncbi:DEAD-domain-containing protein [Hanseniaspora valbyensis NRRL Y-1626]|uniref:ATP-dependent RNA helicase n=1 Tax=Hanseniaspora valbyensis NRRL Y-1626 TaxID=766949 RepID=A0A1B7TCU7_9ASCO|nr:DEAD-domain-containing protein [Hanseniaspora valbyensis NRRL Y-1626]
MAKKLRKSNQERKEGKQTELEQIQALNTRIEEWDIKPNSSMTLQAKNFRDLPLSSNIIKGLSDNGFTKMTAIQQHSIPVSLQNWDIMASAQTGSGKTLAFLIPILEKLYKLQWSEYDGLGALVISPTRELAMQTYEVLLKIGKKYNLAAGLVIGGKDLKFEVERIYKMNILVCTPGRLLQHMDQSAGFDVSNLQMLVLDEADRCLDMGFKKSLDAIISNLPSERQTLLFSATQSQSLESLARLSLTNYKTVEDPTLRNIVSSIKDKDNKTTTPATLQQSYVTVTLPKKLDMLYSFMKTHLKTKMIVFMSSSKQVHFVYETLRKLQPGISLLHLHGRQKQTYRTDVLDKFSKSQHAILFATDVVARGIDFPAVDWVIQVDCPEDVDTYIHRAGRSARNGKNGKNLLILTPSEEEGMLKRLANRDIEPKKLNIKESKMRSITNNLQSLLFQDPELKYLAQKAFISYVKSIYIQKDKEVFKFDELPSEEFAQSLGLPGAPKIKFKGMKSFEKAKELKNTSRQLLLLKNADENGDILTKKDKQVKTKIDKMFERKNQTVLSEHYLNLTQPASKKSADKADGEDEDEEDDFMTVKRKDHELIEEDLPELLIPTSKRAQKKALSKKQILLNQGSSKKLIFDDEGNAKPAYEVLGEEEFAKDGDLETQLEKYINKENENMKLADADDKQLVKAKKLEKKRKRQEKERMETESGYYSKENAEEEEVEDYDEDEIRYVAGTGDLDEDMVSEDESEKRPRKKVKYSRTDDSDSENVSENNVIQVENPETLEDLESLTAKLLQG